MGLIDILILIVIGVGAIQGLLKGFIHQLLSMAAFVAGFIAARMLYVSVAEKLTLFLPDVSSVILQFVAFIAIWGITFIIFALIASLFTHTAELLSLGIFNRILGLLLGAAKWVIVVGLLINVLEFVDTNNELIGKTKKEESTLYYPIKEIFSRFLPAAKNVANDYITF